MQTFGRVLIALSIILIVFSLALALLAQAQLKSSGFDPLTAVLIAFGGLISGSVIFGLGAVQYELQRLNDAMRGYSAKPQR